MRIMPRFTTLALVAVLLTGLYHSEKPGDGDIET
jgi:hypothetical protein